MHPGWASCDALPNVSFALQARNENEEKVYSIDHALRYRSVRLAY
jgi:hypothetical protein